MLTKRIIPCLDVKNGRTVKGTNFLDLRDAGDPVDLAARYSDEGADELVFLDISATLEQRKTFLTMVERAPSRAGLEPLRALPWAGGMTGGHGFFIGPPVNGWIIVTGSGLPKPDGDADECFRFLTELSRKLGHVQFFQSEQALHHHAWVRVENGVVKRAYAWAGETVWNQGAKTAEETELSMKCFSYGEPPGAASWAAAEWMAANAAKVPLLAARWSLDPARIDGRLRKHVAGESPRPD